MTAYKSKTVQIRLVEERDAEFILSCRLDDSLNTFISKIDADLEAQRLWIRKYKISEQNGE